MQKGNTKKEKCQNEMPKKEKEMKKRKNAIKDAT